MTLGKRNTSWGSIFLSIKREDSLLRVDVRMMTINVAWFAWWPAMSGQLPS